MWQKGYARKIEDEREKTIEEFGPVIKHLAYKVSGGYDDETLIEDLISAGVMGLLEAMEKFDAQRGIKLNTFAYLRIKGAMIDELRSRDWFPRSARSKAKQIESVIRKLENNLGRYPKEEEVADALNMDLEQYLSMLKDYGNLSVVSIEDIAEISGEDRENIMHYAVEEGDDPEEFAQFREMEDLIASEMGKLPEKQRLVLSLYYREDMNMKEIAKTLGITEARVCQIHSQSVLNLRTAIQKRTRG